jgi:hypothetical protein
MQLKLVTVILAVALTGCATRQENPKWLADLNKIDCKGAVTTACMTRVSTDHLASAQNSPFLLSGTLHFIAAAEAKGIAWAMPEHLTDSQQSTATAFAEAIRKARTGSSNKALKLADQITDLDSRYLALYFIAQLGQRPGSVAANAALDRLVVSAPDLYNRAMHSRLETLLVTGDIERAFALRKSLIGSLMADDPNLVSDLNDLAMVYARTGMIGDMQDWTHRVGKAVPDLNNGDEGLLRKTMLSAALGTPPSVEELASFVHQEMRFTAYLELARLYRLLGNSHYEKRAIQDAVLFSQVSSMTLDKGLAVEYLSIMLFESKTL